MQKQVIRVRVDYPLSWTFGVEIKQLREDLDTIEKLGATHVEISHGIDYDCSYVDVEAYVDRIETDEEFNVRVEKENKMLNEKQRKELEEFERLKLKYGQNA